VVILYVLAGFAALVVVPVGGLALYLWWQSTIKPQPYSVMFEVRHSDPLWVSRADDGWAITALDGLKPVHLRFGPAPETLGEPLAVARVNGTYHAPAAPQPLMRCFFEIEMEDGRRVSWAERVLPLEGPANFRDLGGYETSDGRRMAWGKVYRADGLDQLTARDQATLQALGLRIMCDLRTYAEVEARPDPPVEGIIYRHQPVFPVDPIGRAGALFSRHRLDAVFKGFYRTAIVDGGAPALGQALRLVAEPANLPLVIHCTGGKDRTGVTSALLLHICGVPRDVIIADYSLTNLAIEKTLAAIRAALAGRKPPPGLRLEQMYPVLSARPELIEQTLDYIDATYGSVDRYLRGPAGLTEAEIEAIRQNLLLSSR